MAFQTTMEIEPGLFEVDEKIQELWETYENLKHPSPNHDRAMGVSESFELSRACPDFIDFIVEADDNMLSRKELERLDDLLQKFELPPKEREEMTDEEKKELETMYRKYLDKKYGSES